MEQSHKLGAYLWAGNRIVCCTVCGKHDPNLNGPCLIQKEGEKHRKLVLQELTTIRAFPSIRSLEISNVN